eukprot:76085-Chlamydomonas_euryale.AAC.1
MWDSQCASSSVPRHGLAHTVHTSHTHLLASRRAREVHSAPAPACRAAARARSCGRGGKARSATRAHPRQIPTARPWQRPQWS